MRSLLNLITDYSEANSMVPMIAIGAIITTIILYLVFRKHVWVSYLVSIIVTIAGLVVLWSGYKEILTMVGLDMIQLGAKILAFGLVSLAFNMILSILDSLAKMFKKEDKKKGNKKSKKKVEAKQVKEEDL